MEYKYQVFPFLNEYLAIGISEDMKDIPEIDTEDISEEDINETDYNIIHLNEIGKEIFEMYIAGQSQEYMVSKLLEEYDATEQEMTALVKNFTEELSHKVM